MILLTHSTKHIVLDLHEKAAYMLGVKQGDNGHRIAVKVTNGAEELDLRNYTGSYVRCVNANEDEFLLECTVNSQNELEFAIPTLITDYAGYAAFEIVVCINESTIVSTLPMKIRVIKYLLNDGAATSKDATLLSKLIKQVVDLRTAYRADFATLTNLIAQVQAIKTTYDADVAKLEALIPVIEGVRDNNIEDREILAGLISEVQDLRDEYNATLGKDKDGAS